MIPERRAVVVVLSATQPWQQTEPGTAEASAYLSLVGNVLVPAFG